MAWWLVSGSRLEDAQERIRELRNQNDELQREVRQLHNNIEWRATGVQTYPEMEVIPERLKNQAVPVVEKEEVDTSKLSITQRAMLATGSRNPRVISNWISRQNVLDFARSKFGAPASELPTREAAPLSESEQARIDAAAEDLQRVLEVTRAVPKTQEKTG